MTKVTARKERVTIMMDNLPCIDSYNFNEWIFPDLG